MARPVKKGLDYFPFDVDFFEDSKIRFIKASFGLKGEAIVIRLMCKAYHNSFFVSFDDDELELFSAEIGEKPAALKEVLKVCFKRGIFSDDAHKTYKVLTSRGIQQRYFAAAERRLLQLSEREKLYLITEETQINATLTPINATLTPINDNINSVKESKEEKTIKKETKEYISADTEKEEVYPFIFNLSFYKEIADELGESLDSISQFGEKFRRSLILKKDLSRSTESITRYFINAFEKGLRSTKLRYTTPEPSEKDRLPGEKMSEWIARLDNLEKQKVHDTA